MSAPPSSTTAAAPAAREGLGIVAAAIAVTAWGSSSVFVKKIEGLDGLAISFDRLALGMIGTLVVFYLAGHRLSWRLLRICLPGGIAFALDIVLFFTALRNTSVANATVIGALQPVLMLVVGPRLFGEHSARSEIGWSFVAVAGTAAVVLAAPDAAGASLRGDLTAVGALLAWTWYFVAAKQARATLGSLEYLAGILVVGTSAVLPVALVFSSGVVPASSTDWLNLVFLALLSGGVGHFLMNWAHGHLRIQLASLLTLLIPVASTAAAVVFLSEAVNGLQAVGMAVVIASLGIVVLNRSRAAAPAVTPSPLAPFPEEEHGDQTARP